MNITGIKCLEQDTKKYEGLSRSQITLVLLFLMSATFYLTWRVDTLNPDAIVFSWLLYGAELFGILTTLLHLFMNWRLRVRCAPTPECDLTVDVFIPTYNETTDMVRKTVIAARKMDYMHQTWLLDDGNRVEMAELAAELDVQYVARKENIGAKAGNLNHALTLSDAEFVAIFDADHAPSRNFLTRTLGYFRDKKVAFVQTPQDFFNLDSYQHRWSKKKGSIWTEQSLFFRVIQRGKDYWNAAFFCGSCAVIRRSALDDIGGFAEETVTEDLHTSLRLHKRGWHSVYHAESLAFGVAPSSVVPFLKQRIRWGQGAMQVWRLESVLTSRDLTLAQRLNYFASMSTYFDGWQKAIFYMAPAIVLLTGKMPIVAIGAEFLWHFIPYYVLTFWIFEEVGRGYGRSVLIEQYNMGRFAGFIWSTLALFKKKFKFQVTQKGLIQKNQTAKFLIPQFSVLLLNAIAIPIGLILFATANHLPLEGVLANAIWALVNISMALSIIMFSMRQSRFKRKEYRFPIPLPAIVNFESGDRVVMTIDDISTNSCRFYGPLPSSLSSHENLSGEIILPSGALPFQGHIAALAYANSEGGRYIKSIGCEFYWKTRGEQDALTLFLYGSDLQWQLLQLDEQNRTPLEILKNWFVKTESIIDRSFYWTSMQYKFEHESSDHPSLGLIALPANNHRKPTHVISFRHMPDWTVIYGRLVTRTYQSEFRAQLNYERRTDSPVNPIYVYKVITYDLIDTWEPIGINEQENSSCLIQHTG